MLMQDAAVAPSDIGGIQTRGIEGADAVGEEAPLPEWITEERMRQVQKDLQAK